MAVITKQIQRDNFRGMRRVRRYIGNKVNSYCIHHRLTDKRFAARSGLPVSVLQTLRRDQYDMTFLDLWTFASLLNKTALQLMLDAHANRQPRFAIEGDIFLVEPGLS